jgi:hypothetical protein
MNAMVEPQAFVLPKKPKVRQKDAPPDQRSLAVLPIRAGRDQRLHGATLRCLIVLCSYCNRAGITWVGQAKLAQDLEISRQAVTKQIKMLIETGYVEIIKKGFRGERANTLRVIFDKSVDADTAIAITSAQENTRPPSMQDETPDPEGQRRIAQLLARALKQPVTKKEYTMPKTGQTRTVQKMHEEIAKAAKKKTSHKQPPEVANEDLSIGNPQRLPHRQPSEVAQTQEEHIRKVINKDSFKEVKDVLGNQSRVELREAGLTDGQIDDSLAHLLDAYQAEGLTPDHDRLPGEILQLARAGL